ncbi:RuBisCO large subunit C-terminal-like domain-containing protein [Paenibacillus pasadenensis]|uniref:RuBisCO large subunit C-terminal-like domain-containing protein n=1 Tax=Paenibacillus pasadenensis TaxID=217090 RepID=UPI00203E2D64|nr:RuBisCO large subunit C-terminal-like domain-containing protein [Paenibacillus pasadenensis]MCM3747049.1 RuBisCO large subunit C-terminal-like domain-containing protein [Paenibacillus pasadenensis]
MYTLMEEAKDGDYVIATYYMALRAGDDIVKKAAALAVGQTLGTWLPVPGIDDAMRERHMGRVVNIYDVPPSELTSPQDADKQQAYLVQLAFPSINFGAQFPMLLTTLLGNDASTSSQAKLVDLQLPRQLALDFGGPRFGVEGIRDMTGVYGRPLIMNMIKPCTGLTPEAGAAIFYETALGGVDIIKDDELLGNPPFSPIEKRVKAYVQAAESAYGVTGQRTRYIVNITDSPERIADNARRAEEAGADAVMVNFAAAGYGAVRQAADAVNLPVLGHYAAAGMYYEGASSGMSSPLAVGRLPRLAGADMVVINTPYGNYPLRPDKYFRTAHQLTLPFYGLKPTMPAVGGGLHPGMVERYIADLGKDIVLATGGAIQGHPGGAAAGGKAMRQAVDAAMNGVSAAEHAKSHPELQTALELWHRPSGSGR